MKNEECDASTISLVVDCCLFVAVRSTNQAEDPGATDYLDVVLGPQDPALFKLPAYCKNIINKGCPPDWP